MSAVRYLFDEDFNGKIIRGVRRRAPTLDALNVQDIGLRETPDPVILEWAANEDRVLVSHDHRTMRAYAEERLQKGVRMSGLVLVRQHYPIGQAIDDLVLIGEITTAEEWQGKIVILPL